MLKLLDKILAISNFFVFIYLFLPLALSDSSVLSVEVENEIVFLFVMTFNSLFCIFSSKTFLKAFYDNDTTIEVAMLGITTIILSFIFIVLELPFTMVNYIYLFIIITAVFNIFKVLELFFSASMPFLEGY